MSSFFGGNFSHLFYISHHKTFSATLLYEPKTTRCFNVMKDNEYVDLFLPGSINAEIDALEALLTNISRAFITSIVQSIEACSASKSTHQNCMSPIPSEKRRILSYFLAYNAFRTISETLDTTRNSFFHTNALWFLTTSRPEPTEPVMVMKQYAFKRWSVFLTLDE